MIKIHNTTQYNQLINQYTSSIINQLLNVFNKQQTANKVENQFSNQRQKLTNYSIDLVSDFSQSILQTFLFVNNRIVKFSLFLNNSNCSIHVIIINNNNIATIKKIINSKKKRIIKNESNFVTISLNFVSKSILFTHYLRATTEETCKQ